LAFSPTTTTPDYIVIQPGRARLYINKSDTQFSYPVSNNWSEDPQKLEVLTGATQVFVSAISSVALIVALVGF